MSQKKYDFAQIPKNSVGVIPYDRMEAFFNENLKTTGSKTETKTRRL